MTPLARHWLRRIALGLPLVGMTSLTGCSSFGGSSSCDGFDPMNHVEHHPVTLEQAAMLSSTDGGIARTCDDLCNELDPGPLVFDVRSCAVVEGDGGLLLRCDHGRICRGRPAAGLLARAPGLAGGAIGAFLADAAHMEAASVPAFLDLAHEMTLHRAPRAMIDAARRSARDEVRHARTMAQLAARFEAIPAPVERVATEARSLHAMAEDNAVHGCVGEAHAAFVAAFQASCARGPVLRRTWSEIARDEARHALLSFALHDWVSTRLDARTREATEDARRCALSAIEAELQRELPAAARDALCLPDAQRAIEMARALA